jgi:hypothetical protein
MDQFSFLSVLISVILGLAVAEILQGFRGLPWSRTRIQIYWPVIGWGCPGAPCLFSALVVDVWNANPSRLDGSAIR